MPAADVTPDTPLSLELLHLEASLCDSATFRSVVATPDAEYADLVTDADALISGSDLTTGRDDAAAKVAWYEVDEEENPEDEQTALPRAILHHGESSIVHRGGLQMQQGGFIVVLLELAVPAVYTTPRTQAQKKNLFRWGLGIVGRIQREIMNAQQRGGRLVIDRLETDVNQIGVYDRAEAATPDEPDVFFAVFRVFHQGP